MLTKDRIPTAGGTVKITNKTAQVWIAFACEYWPAALVLAVLAAAVAAALDAPY
jgi:hypothetical protein